MLCDEDADKRKNAINAILNIRHSKNSKIKMNKARNRVFKVPELNWEVKEYTEIIPWRVENFTEPPVTKTLSDEQLKEGYEKPLHIPKYPVHSQYVERCVKLVSEAFRTVYGFEKRHGVCISRQCAREETPSFVTKKEYNVKYT